MARRPRQPGRAALGGLGLDPVRQARVTVDPLPGAGGPEAAARRARYTALEEVAHQTGAAAVLLGHTRDDQAETVLLGLARGSGARALASMPARRGRFRRPMLGLSRATLREACRAQRLDPWDDPHNCDPSYARVRVRHTRCPRWRKPSARGSPRRWPAARPSSARIARPWTPSPVPRSGGSSGCAGSGWRGLHPRGPARRAAARRTGEGGGREATILSVADIDGLGALAPAIRTRVLRQAALLAGCPGGSLTPPTSPRWTRW